MLGERFGRVSSGHFRVAVWRFELLPFWERMDEFALGLER